MKLTRLVHSCLLIEDKSNNILIDPGQYSFEDSRLEVSRLPKVDYILITHWHEDHCSPQFIEEIIKHSPEVEIISNGDVANVLAAHHLQVKTEAPEGIEMLTLEHAELWQGMQQLKNSVFTIAGKLTHFGDNRELKKVNYSGVVAFPITAPWGSLADAIDKLVESKPKKVLPIHDWHLSDYGRKYYYEKLKVTLADENIEFIPLEPTDSLDI